MKTIIALILLTPVVWFIVTSSIYAHQCSQKRKGRGDAQ